MVSPGLVAHKGAQRLVIGVGGSRLDFLCRGAQMTREAAHELDALDKSAQVVLLDIGALVEVAEVDHRRVERIGASKRHPAAAILGVRFQNGPGKQVVLNGYLFRIALEVPFEESRQAEDAQIRREQL